MGLALGAIPLTHAERQVFQDVTADVASLARRKESINLLQRLPVAVALVGQHRVEHAERSVRETSGETVVANHTAHVQILDTDRIEPANEVGRDLVHMVRSGIGNVSVNLGNMQAGTLTTPTALDSPCEHALRSCQLSLPLFTVAHVRNPLTIREGGEAGDPEVNPDRCASLGQFLEGFVEAERHEVLPDGVLGYRTRCRDTAKLSTPADLQVANLGDGQGLVERLELEARTGVLSGLLPVLALEGRIAGSALEEVAEGTLQMSQGLLCRNGRDLVQPGMVIGLFEGWTLTPNRPERNGKCRINFLTVRIIFFN